MWLRALHTGGTRITERRGWRWGCTSTSVTGSVWKAVDVKLIWYNSTICHVRVLRWSMQGVPEVQRDQFQRSDLCARDPGAMPLHGAHQGWLVKRARNTKVRWIIIFSTWPLRSADPIALEGTTPARPERAADQRDHFAVCKFLGGATPTFSHRGSSSRLRRVINSHLRGRWRCCCSMSQQIPFKDNRD